MPNNNDIEELKKILSHNKLELIRKKIEKIYHNDEEKHILYYIPYNKFYYSSYHNLIDINKKNYIWCTHILSQALLHIFDTIRTIELKIEPVLFRLKLNKLKLIKSYDKDNINIFADIIDTETLNKIKKYFKNTYGGDDINIFNQENNKRILYVLEIINSILSEELKFDGYYNEFDQNETAFINNNLIEDYNISKYISIKIKMKALYKFPIDKSVFIELISDKPITYTDIIDIGDKTEKIDINKSDSKQFKFTNFFNETSYDKLYDISLEGESLEGESLEGESLEGESSEDKKQNFYKPLFQNDKYRMICDIRKVEYIEYEDFDTKNILQYKCKLPKEYYYECKYLKYKIKYLELKKDNDNDKY